MEYLEYKPKKELETFVKCYWTLEGTPNESERRQTILPDGNNDIIIIFGDDIDRINPNSEKITLPKIMASGQLSKPHYYYMHGYCNVFGIRFFPYGLSAFSEISKSLIVDSIYPLDFIFGKEDSQHLSYAMKTIENINTKILAIEEFLSSKLINLNYSNLISKDIIEQLYVKNQLIQINTLLKETVYDRRRIQRSFSKEVGIPLKKIERILRFKTAVEMLRDNTELISIAQDIGYYDQAHFINDFKKLAGCTPSEMNCNPEYLVSNLFI